MFADDTGGIWGDDGDDVDFHTMIVRVFSIVNRYVYQVHHKLIHYITGTITYPKQN